MSKRPQSPDLIPNPFVKKRNLAWTIHDSSAYCDDDHQDGQQSLLANDGNQESDKISTAAVESGQEIITNHLEHFSTILSSHTQHSPLLSVPDYSELYKSSIGNPHGAHFVIHQHDHPVAGTHYDLRLQINETSSASWAIMYGLPGDPNSKRLNRNATETRIHCLWVSSLFFHVVISSPAMAMLHGTVRHRTVNKHYETRQHICEDHMLTRNRPEPSCRDRVFLHWVSYYMGHWDLYSSSSHQQIRTCRRSRLTKLLQRIWFFAIVHSPDTARAFV